MWGVTIAQPIRRSRSQHRSAAQTAQSTRCGVADVSPQVRSAVAPPQPSRRSMSRSFVDLIARIESVFPLPESSLSFLCQNRVCLPSVVVVISHSRSCSFPLQPCDLAAPTSVSALYDLGYFLRGGVCCSVDTTLATIHTLSPTPAAAWRIGATLLRKTHCSIVAGTWLTRIGLD